MNIGTEVNSIEQLSTLSKSKHTIRKKVSQKVSYVQAEMSIGKYFVLPIKLECATNKREHWTVIAKRKQEQRMLAGMYTHQVWRADEGNFTITITRIGLRKMDSDNLATSAKYVRDGVADALGIDDGDSRIEWVYKQEIGREYGCKVEITSEKG